LDEALTDASTLDHIHVQSPDRAPYTWDANVVWDTAASVTADGAAVKMADGLDSYALTWQVPDSSDIVSNGHNLRLSGFKVLGNKYNRSSGGCLTPAMVVMLIT